jgi:hypothetical protein
MTVTSRVPKKLRNPNLETGQVVEEAGKECEVAGGASAIERLLDLAGSGLWKGDLSEMREDNPG